MISSIFKFVSLARQALRGGASPASLAAGVTAGFLAGIIPNDSLVVPVIVMVVMAHQPVRRCDEHDPVLVVGALA